MLTNNLGSWLLDHRLVGKRLDVRISRTGDFHKGKYEGKMGFVVLKSTPTTISDSVEVRVGHDESRRHFRLHHLTPERTMEIPYPEYMKKDPGMSPPVISTPGTRVIVIGADSHGNTDFVGNFGTTLASPYPQFACVLLSQTWPPTYSNMPGFFPPDSLCRSLV